MTPASGMAAGRRGSAAARAGLSLAGGILGAGALLVPPVVLGLAGTAALGAWAVHIAVGLGFCVALGLLARARGGGSIAEVAAAALGERAATAITCVYLAGFVTGQAAIATFAGRLLAGAAGGGGGLAAAGGVAVLVLATAGVLAGWSPGARARRARLAATLALATLLFAGPEALVAGGLVAGAGGAFWVAVFLVFFAGVGWEGMARTAPALPGSRDVGVAAATAAAAVALAYLPLAALAGVTVRDGALVPGGLAGPVAGAVAALLVVYCLTNIAAAAGFAGQLGLAPPTGPAAALAVGGVAVAVHLAATRAGLGVAHLLAVPAAAAWVAYCLAMLAALRAGPRAARPFAGAVLLALLALLAGAVYAAWT